MYASQIARYIANSHPACNRNGPSEPADKKEGSIKVEGTNDASISFPFLRYRRRNVGWSRSFPHIRGGRGATRISQIEFLLTSSTVVKQ